MNLNPGIGGAPAAGEESELLGLLNTLKNYDAKLEAVAAADDDERERETASIIEAQCDILKAATQIKGGLIQDAFVKLAIWRKWQGDEICDEVELNSPADALVLSVYNDLAAFFNEPV